MEHTNRLLDALRDFLPEEEYSRFKEFVNDRDPQLFDHLSSSSKHQVTPRGDVYKCLKWAIKEENIASLQLLLDSKTYTHEDACVLACHKGKKALLDIFSNYGVVLNSEMFSAACTSGNLDLAKQVERELSYQKNSYNPEETYDGIDYNTALYGAIAKSRKDVVEWLTSKVICPDYTIIARILPAVTSPEVVATVVRAAPKANKKTVLTELNKLIISPRIENLITAIVYKSEDVASAILALPQMESIISSLSLALKSQITSILVLSDQHSLLDAFLLLVTIEEVKMLVDKFSIDCKSKKMLSVLMKSSPSSENRNFIRASVKIGDFKTAELLGYKKDVMSTFEGAIFGNHPWLVKEICEKKYLMEQVESNKIAKLLAYSRHFGYSDVSKVLERHIA